MDFTCGLVDKFRDLVLDLFWEQLLYLVYYHQNIEQLNERLEELTLERSSIQHQIEEATNNLEKIEEKVRRWLLKVDEISEQVQKFHEEASQAKRDCTTTSCPNLWLRYKLSKRAKAMAQEVVEICVKGNFPTVSYRVPPQSMPELTNRSSESNEGVSTRVLIMNQVMEALRNPSVNMVGLCGLGGVGKTTIAKEVAKNQKMFEKVIMATVSDELNIENIQSQISEKLGMQLNEKTKDVRASRLYERLKQEKNMLLILDDLWEELDLLIKVGIPFVDVQNCSKNNECCKILLTSRNETLLSNCMNCRKIIKVDVLPENESWELFKRIAELSVDSSGSDLISIATEIVQKCGGLPLAIVTAAKALRKKDVNEWKDALARLKNPLRRNITGIKEVDTILKFSYNHLSSENKNIFLLAAMLSHDLSIEDMLMYSVGLDFLDGIENMEEAHVGISVIVSKLKSLNLFLESSSNHHFTMHDVFRDVALSIASDELHAFIVRHRRLNTWPEKNRLEGYRGICLQQSDISDFPEELHGPRLEFFMLNSTKCDLTIPSMFFKSSKELKVLAITNVHFLLLPSLSFLQKLKALCLRSCVLEDITETRNLKNLKVLSLAYSEIERLPIELAELISLQMLSLSHCTNLKVIPQGLLSSLKRLEVLYMENSFDKWKVEGSSEANENASLDELEDLPISYLDIQIPDVSMLPENLFFDMNLKRYRIIIGKDWEWQDNNETLKILKLELESSIHLKRGLHKLLEDVEDLHLRIYDGLENVLYSHDGRGFRHLRHLHIEYNDDIKYIILNSAHHEALFPILESLEIHGLHALEKLCQGLNAFVFLQLHTLKMGDLPALNADHCIKDRATNNVSNKIIKSLFNDKMLLPRLEILELFKLNHMISSIWDEQLSHNSFSNLRILTVENCGFVKLMPLHVLKSLHNLEELKVWYCGMLETVFDFEDLNDHKEIMSSSVIVPLKKLELWNLPELKNVWSNHHQGNISFQSLRSVEVSFCKSLTSIFPASIAKGMLHDLQELIIIHCGIDVIVAKDQVSDEFATVFEFPRLTSLDISSAPNLRNFYPHRHKLEYPHLQELSIAYCGELEIFGNEVLSSSEIHEEERVLNSKYPLLSYKVLCNLEKLKLGGKEAEMIASGHFSMYHFPKVKLLDLLFSRSTTISYRSLFKSFPSLEVLELWGAFNEAFEGDDVAVHAGPLSKLTLKKIFNTISFAPSLVLIPNLTHLDITFSDELTTLMTSSAARSLVNLTHLSFSHCRQIEEVITMEEGEDVDREISFSKLECLELSNLDRLKRFSNYSYTFRLPLLNRLTITRCPKLKEFSPGLIDAPSLKSVQLPGQQFWDTNLNKTFGQQRFFSSRALVLYENDASMIRNDQFPVHRCPKVEILHIERFVDEGLKLPYATLLEIFPQLNGLHVEDSSFEEIFPSHAHIVDQIPPFKELFLVNLDQLKNIWMDDSQLPPIQNLEILRVKNCFNLIKLAPSSTIFDKLTELKVSNCHQLFYLVTSSMAKGLVSLVLLKINDCRKMEEIVTNETNEDVEGKITFKRLWRIKLTNMSSLKMFSSQSQISEFPELKKIKIIGCPEMKVFCSRVLETPKLSKVKIEEHYMVWENKGDLNKLIEMISSTG